MSWQCAVRCIKSRVHGMQYIALSMYVRDGCTESGLGEVTLAVRLRCLLFRQCHRLLICL